MTRLVITARRPRGGFARVARCALLALACSLMLAVLGRPVRAEDEPTLPAKFDGPTVQGLVDKIDEGYNSSILKFPYFDSHRDQPLPLAAGYKLIEKAVAGEKPQAKRWFYLESVRAFAALHIGPDTREAGLKAYAGIFDGAANAIAADAAYPLQRSVYEFVFAMPTQYVVKSPQDLDGATPVLFKAFTAYLLLLKAGQPGKFEPQWDRVMGFTAADSRFGSAMDRAMADAAMSKSLQLYKLAALVYKYTDSEKAAKMLEDAKKALPADDAEQTEALYGELVDEAVKNEKWPQAIASQKELIQRTGKGKARLVLLYFQSNDAEMFGAAVKALHAPDANAQDINDLAWILLWWGSHNKERLPRLRRESQSLLQDFLKAPRDRRAEDELVARTILAQSFWDEKRIAEARAVLAAAPAVRAGDAAELGELHAGVRQMLRRLDAPPPTRTPPAVPVKTAVKTATSPASEAPAAQKTPSAPLGSAAAALVSRSGTAGPKSVKAKPVKAKPVQATPVSRGAQKTPKTGKPVKVTRKPANANRKPVKAARKPVKAKGSKGRLLN